MTEEAKAACDKFDIRIEVLSGPTATVEDGWAAIGYEVRLLIGAKEVLTTSYRMGVGCVDWKKISLGKEWFRLTPEERGMAEWIISKHGHVADFKDKNTLASLATKVAIMQKVKPTREDVLHGLLLDGTAYFNAQTFEEWATDCDYDPDSRKAEGIFRACDETGRKLTSALGRDAIDELLEAFQGY